MTLDEAVDEILTTCKDMGWQREGTHEKIRCFYKHETFSWDCTHCPLTALLEKKQGKRVSIHDASTAGSSLGITPQDRTILIYAADNHYDGFFMSKELNEKVKQVREKLLTLTR